MCNISFDQSIKVSTIIIITMHYASRRSKSFRASWKTPVFIAQRRPNAMYVSSIEKAIYLLKLDSANEGVLPLTLPVCFPNDDNNETSIKLKYYPLYFSEVLSHLALGMVEWKIQEWFPSSFS